MMSVTARAVTGPHARLSAAWSVNLDTDVEYVRCNVKAQVGHEILNFTKQG